MLWLPLMLILALADAAEWKCPELKEQTVTCTCDFPHTLQCSGGPDSLTIIRKKLQFIPEEESISLLDCTVQNLTELPDAVLVGISLHGLVITSGELRNISNAAFQGLVHPLLALGLPNNRLTVVPTEALTRLDALERLDLSHNSLTRLMSGSFLGLNKLTFLDLSSNRINRIKGDAFSGLKALKVLNLRNNRIGNGLAPALYRLENVEEIDMSTNALTGPLQKGTVPSLPSLRILFLANNQFSSIRKDALIGASSLMTLSVNNNHIDVLEDHAFRGLSRLRSLDLSNNRIVAISSASLAHLEELTELDLSHNFLRALTGDIINPLKNLQVLHLDDNDISIVTSDWTADGVVLQRLTLSDNPLNCDCSLLGFANWFNRSRLSNDDRSTVICATPPHLENALLTEVSPKDLICEDGDAFHDGSTSAQAYEAQVGLRTFSFDGSVITLLWNIDTRVKAFTCDALFVYEETSTHEVLLNSTPLRCNSSQLVDPTALIVRLPLGNMQQYHRYRYCVVLFEDSKFSDEMRLILGCSEVIPLVASEKAITQPPAFIRTRIDALHASVSLNGITISVTLRNQRKPPDEKCHVTVTIFETAAPISQYILNCSSPKIFIQDLPQGRYHVCATLDNYSVTEAANHQCATVILNNSATSNSGLVITLCFLFLALFSAAMVYVCIRKIVRRYRLRSTIHQCFLATDETEYESRKQHSQYIKLQTTTEI